MVRPIRLNLSWNKKQSKRYSLTSTKQSRVEIHNATHQHKHTCSCWNNYRTNQPQGVNMKKITNNQMSEYTTFRRTFRTTNETVYAQYEHNHNNPDSDLYVVYSYGKHFPMYIYDEDTQSWYGNEDKNSVTTLRHQTLARPDSEHITALPTHEMSRLISLGGYRNYCADRCGVLAFTTTATTV